MRSKTAARLVLVIDDDQDVSALIREVLSEEGYDVTCLLDGDLERISATVGRAKPDCVLLDGGRSYERAPSWDVAAWFAERLPLVPVVMLSVQAADVREAQERTSSRAIRAGFAAIVPKPFDLDALIAAVAGAAGGPSSRWSAGDAAGGGRTA